LQNRILNDGDFPDPIMLIDPETLEIINYNRKSFKLIKGKEEGYGGDGFISLSSILVEKYMDDVIKEMHTVVKTGSNPTQKEKKVEVMVGEEENHMTEEYKLHFWQTEFRGKKVAAIRFVLIRIAKTMRRIQNVNDTKEWKINFYTFLSKKLMTITTSLTNDIIANKKLGILKENEGDQMESVYRNLYGLSCLKTLVNNELIVEDHRKEPFNSFSPVNVCLNVIDQSFICIKAKNVKMILEIKPNFPDLIRTYYTSYWSFFMTLFLVFADVSNAEIKMTLDWEDAMGDIVLDHKITITMKNPSGAPPGPDLFDKEVADTGLMFDDNLPFLLKGLFFFRFF
jgi:hypothetical protein